jgi:H+/Cl- antiporter ClcA
MDGAKTVIVGNRIFGGAVELPGDMANADFWKQVVRYQFLYSVFGLIAGLACILLGLVLIVNGVASDGHWTANLFGVHLTDASPGVVLFIVGLLLPKFTAFTVRSAAPTTPPTPPQPPKS